MYERNAIVIDRYFSSIFGYDNKNNLKVNKENYFELVDILEKYQHASETENNIMDEFEKIAKRIKEIQKKQEELNKKNLKCFNIRKSLFDNLDENEEDLKNKFEKIQDDIKTNEDEIKDNSVKFVQEIKEFNEKSEVRSECGRERRIIESDYQKILNTTIDNFNNLLKEELKKIKSFIKKQEKEDIKDQIKEKIFKNGAKEKVPFDSNVINKAIDTSLYIEQKKVEILLSIYDKTSKLLNEIKNDTVEIEKHKKQVKDSKSKLDFLNVITDYIVLFLDNERMNTIGGEAEHQKVMFEACNNLQSDLTEIQNMYSLLIKEINGKATKKLYKQLYNIDYLNELKEQELKFEKNISKLNMVGTVIYPEYWRIEGMQKIYDTFRSIITDVYKIDLTEFEPLDITFEVKEDVLESESENLDEKNNEEIIENKENEEIIENEEIVEQEKTSEITLKSEDLNYEHEEKETNETENKNENDEEDDDEFYWDEDDEEDELIFNKNEKDIQDEETEIKFQVEEENDEEDDERDKEIDELLGIFDSEDIDETSETEDDIENHILQIEEDDDELDDSIFKNDDDEKEDKKQIKEKTKRKSLFGRRK